MPAPPRTPAKLSNRQYFNLLKVHEENLAALRDLAQKPAKFEQDLYDGMCKTMNDRFSVKMSPMGMRSQIWRLKERVERKVNAAACKSGSTDEEVLLKTAGFSPVEAHLYRLLTDKVLPLVVKDQREHQREHATHSSRSRSGAAAAAAASADDSIGSPPEKKEKPSPKKASPKKAANETPKRKAPTAAEKAAAAAAAAAPPAAPAETKTEEPPKKKARPSKKKPTKPATEVAEKPAAAPAIVDAHSEPESNNVDAYMDTIERVAQMGRVGPSWYDEQMFLESRTPAFAKESPEKKKKSRKTKKEKLNGESASPQANGVLTNGVVDKDQLLNLTVDANSLRLGNEDLLGNNTAADPVLREKQLLCRTQRLLAAQRIALQSRQAEMLQSQTKFYDAWSGLASTFASFFRLMPPMPANAGGSHKKK